MKVKFVAAAVVILILIGLPIGSYLYLRSGYMYRLDALESLDVKGALDADFYCFTASDSIKYGELLGYTLVVTPCELEEEWKTKMTQLDEQFTSSPTYRSLKLEGDEIMKSTGYADCYFTPQFFYDGLFREHSFVLLDTSLQIRNFYAPDEPGFKKLVEHLAILLPREKEKKIEFKGK